MNIYRHVIGQGDDIVILHGWGCDHRYMQPIVNELSSSFTVTNVDLPGRGQSHWTEDITNIHDIADLLLPHLPQQATYVVWSFGGLVTLSIASRYPERVKRIIGVAISPRFIEDTDWPGIPKPGFKAAFSSITEKKDLDPFFLRFFEAEFADFKTKPSGYKRLTDLLKGTPHNAQNISVLLKGIDICDTTDLREEFKLLQCPIDIIMGEKDDCIPSDAHAAIKDLNKQTNLHIIPEAKHMMFWTHSKEFNNLLQNII